MGAEYEDEVAPEMFENELLSDELCHWYDIVPLGAVAETVRVAVPPLYTLLLLGWVEIVGAATETVTEAELESLYFVYPFRVLVTRAL